MWLELTSRCNLRCIHCYSNSSPDTSDPRTLEPETYISLLREARSLGCLSVQFIGGEPSLHPHLPTLIDEAGQLQYDFIEVYTNLVSLPSGMLDAVSRNGAAIATSFYAASAAVHDAVTNQDGSWAKTLRNIKRLVAGRIPLRVGFIEMDTNRDEYDDAVRLLNAHGVTNVARDHQRPFGRAEDRAPGDLNVGGLCGNCTSGNVCILPNGDVTLCIMSRELIVGSVYERPLRALLDDGALTAARSQLDQAWAEMADGPTAECGPNCKPSCEPVCNPRCSPNCSPCFPAGKCNPELFRGEGKDGNLTAWLHAPAEKEPA